MVKIMNRAWEWPAILSNLHRTDSLSVAQRAQLTTWLYPSEIPSPTASLHELQIPNGLRQFSAAVSAALNYCAQDDAQHTHAAACSALLLKEIHLRQTSLWSWSAADWIEIIGIDQQAFTARHQQFQRERSIEQVGIRTSLILCSYLLSPYAIFAQLRTCAVASIAQRAFGRAVVDEAVRKVQAEIQRIGRSATNNAAALRRCLCHALLLSRDPRLPMLTLPVLEQLYQDTAASQSAQRACVIISRVLHSLEIVNRPLRFTRTERPLKLGKEDNIPLGWLTLMDSWCNDLKDDMQPCTLINHRILVAKAARWAAATYPAAANPDQWTPQMARAFVKAVTKMKRGEWTHPNFKKPTDKIKQNLLPASKGLLLNVLRRFFTECALNYDLQLRIKPSIHLATPRAITKLCQPDPKPIRTEIWQKLQQAAIDLCEEDLPVATSTQLGKSLNRETFYPLAFVRALAITWVFGGLRSDEIRRLRVGCTRVLIANSEDGLLEDVTSDVCILLVPPGKAVDAFEKPVDVRVREAVIQWEQQRPRTARQRDERADGQLVDFLFMYRGQHISGSYINKRLIPLLCRKAGIAEQDAVGNITSHRARATIATLLYEAQLNIFELQMWLGHNSLRTTQYYVKINLKALTESYLRARQICRNLAHVRRLVEEDNEATRMALLSEETASSEEDDLRHLRPRPARKADHSFYLLLQQAIQQIQQTTSLSKEQNQVLIDSLRVLKQLAGS